MCQHFCIRVRPHVSIIYYNLFPCYVVIPSDLKCEEKRVAFIVHHYNIFYVVDHSSLPLAAVSYKQIADFCFKHTLVESTKIYVSYLNTRENSNTFKHFVHKKNQCAINFYLFIARQHYDLNIKKKKQENTMCSDVRQKNK